MKKFLQHSFFALFLLLSHNVQGQTASYNFSVLSGPFVSIAGGATTTSTTAISADDANVGGINIGFPFTFCGVPYSTLSACSNGWLSLAGSGSNTWVNLSGNIVGAGMLMPFWDDLRGNDPFSGIPTGTLYYQTTGPIGSRVFTIEFSNWSYFGVAGGAASTEVDNFQVKLYEGSTTIDFCYGPNAFPSGRSGTIGIANDNISDYKTVDAAAASATAATFTVGFPTGITNGTIFRWSQCPVTVIASNDGPLCPGGTAHFTGIVGGGGTSWTWSGPAGFTTTTLSPTIATVTSAMAGIYTLSATNGTCSTVVTTPLVVNSGPAPFTITPSSASVCGTAQMLTAPFSTATVETLITYPSIHGPFVIPDATPSGATDFVTVAGVPGSWSIVNASVTLTNITMTFDGDLSFGIEAPNTNILNIFNRDGGGGDNFLNTEISSIGVNPLPPGVPPFTGLWAADAAFGVGPTGLASNVGTWPPLYSIINGAWTLVCRDHAGADVATVNNWALNLTYDYPGTATYTWAPLTGLYLDAAMTIPYTGTPTYTVYALPSATTVYTATASVPGVPCTGSATATISVSAAPIAGVTNVCVGVPSSLSDPTPGGTWSSTTTAVGTIGSTTGVFVGVTPGTTTVFYNLAGCSASTVVTVNANPSAISGVFTTCVALTTTLSNAISGGTYTSSTPGVATVGLSTGIVTGVAPGTSTITYTTGPGCTVTAVVTVGTISAITGTPSVCVGYTTPLGHPTSGGTWTSSASGIASVVGSTGVVTGVAAGTARITYTLPSSCYTTVVVTVNSNPTAIGPTLSVCAGTTTVLSSTPAGGTWSSTTPLVASIGSSSGALTANSGGTSVITYTAPTTGCYITGIVTVNTVSPITGTAFICVGLTAALSDASPGGTWTSSNTAVATVGSTSGVVFGAGAGTSTITYTITSSGCFTTTTATVNASPSAITGTFYVCSGFTTTLADATAGGTWSSSATATATVDAAGVVTGVASGTSTITYSLGAGCTSTAVVTVNASPAAIAGAAPICAGTTLTLTDATTGGTWSSSPGATVVPFGVGTGVVTGGAGGTPTITYTIPPVAPMPTGCYSTATITVNPLPAAITGIVSFCQGTATTLADATAGGTWSSLNPSVANADPATGIITGLLAGTTSIIYILPTGCSRSRTVTVNPAPATIGGSLGMCEGVCNTLTDATTGGTWSSSTPGVATIGSTSGIICGAFAGNTVITYTGTGGCYTVAIATVYSTPPAITGTASVCPGTTTTLANAIPGGVWSSGAPGTGSVTITSGGVVTGGTVGTTTVTYTTTGCTTTRIVTVTPLPAAITGTFVVCQGYTTTLADASAPGTWSSSNTAVATVGSSNGAVSGVSGLGTSLITFTAASSGCYVTAPVTVNPAPAAITATSFTVCIGLTTTMSDATPSGTWSVGAPASGGATIVAATGVLTGGTAGTVTVTYTAPVTGCITTTIVTVNPLPGAITGVASLCELATTTLSNSVSGGAWSSGNTAVATIGTSGIVSGVSGGTSVITYTLGSGCIATRIITVNPLPAAIGGSLSVCVGSTTLLSNTSTGGTWLSGTPAVATISSASGNVSGLATGTSNITYTITATGCLTTAVVTVYPVPAVITGTTSVCPGNTTTFADVTPGGNWTSGTPAVATVDPFTGIVTGASAGTSVISYILSATGCYATRVVTVNALPGSISGPSAVCVGSAILLTTTSSGGTWISSAAATATAGSTSGIVTGVSAGVDTIIFKITASGCIITTPVTVNPLPGLITVAPVCPGTTTTASTISTGGTWSATCATLTIGSASGIVTGMSAGTCRITYTLPTGCLTTAVDTVNPSPAAIGGATTVCPGSTATVTNTSGGGTWSASAGTGTATIGSSSGIVTGGTPGTIAITYTLPTGCMITSVMTVNPLPAPITGGLAVCLGLTTTLSDASTPGTWASSAPLTAPITPGGVVSGNISGFSTITFTETATGCNTTAVVTVNGLPPAITGIKTLCPGTCTTLFNAAAGGAWSSSSALVTVTSGTSGTVCGSAPGTATITYTIGTGCIVTTDVTINPLPAPISGALGVCIGLTGTLADITSGGAWSSNNTAIAGIGTSTGIVTGVAVGTANVTYTLSATGCYATAIETINPLPATITGSNGFCNLTNTFYHSTSPGGTWTSSDPTIASIDPVTGEAIGNSPGNCTLTYTLPTGCITTKTITIILAPYPISGPTDVCEGQTITLDNTIGGGTWSSSAPVYGTIDIASGVVGGISAGSTTITYVLSTGCFSVYDVTVNVTPVAIAGNLQVCYGLTTSLSDGTPGGAWSSSDATIAGISGLGVVTGINAGTATISYTMPTGCNATAVLTVNPLPAPITGIFQVCLGLTTSLGDTSAGGTWSSSAPSTAGAVAATGVVAGLDPGTATITYTLPTGCIITQDVTVNPLPATITGIFDVCIGLSVTMNDATGTGNWSSSDPTIAYIDAGGVVTGMSYGTATITYMLPTGCISTAVVTINALPPAIGGNLQVCPGFTSNLTDASTGGTWSSDASAIIGYINMYTGVVSGVSPGTMNITYTLPSGCLTNAVVTVNVLPSPIYGTFELCQGSTATLNDIDVGGTWTSSNMAVGTIDLVTGIMSGLSAGVTEISYTFVTTGCTNRVAITVDPLPAAITGSSVVCQGSILTLSDATPGGAWSSSIIAVANFVDPTYGYLTAYTPGVTTVTYANTITHCSVTKAITVNPVPAIITGPSGVCLGSTVLLTDSTAGGTWSSSNAAVAPVGVTSGVVSGLTLGSALITYKLGGTGCLRTKLMTVNPLPAVHTVTGGGSYCAGGNGVHIGLNGSDIGISYALYYGSSATGYLAGTGAPLDFGLLTPGGVYTVLATNAISGCTKNMLGSATVIINPTIIPSVALTTATGSDTVCPGAPTNFYATATPFDSFATYTWKVNGITVATTHNYSFLPANGDVVSVKLTSTLACASPATASDSIKITLLPSGTPIALVSATPGDTVCEYTPTTFNASSVFGGYGPQYAWLVNGAVVGSGTSYSYTPNDGDIVSLRLISNYQCRTTDTVLSTNVTMSVHPLLIPHIEILSNPGLSVDTGQVDSLSTIVINAGSHPTYQWQINGIPIPGATNSWYVGTFHDYDSVNCMVTSSDVCHGVSTFDWVFISLHPTGITGITASFDDIRLVPNPNKGVFSIKGSLGVTIDQDITLEVTDMLGQVVYKTGIIARKGRIDQQVILDNTLANGMYMLNLRSPNQGKVFHFVIEQ